MQFQTIALFKSNQPSVTVCSRKYKLNYIKRSVHNSTIW